MPGPFSIADPPAGLGGFALATKLRKTLNAELCTQTEKFCHLPTRYG
jgi:hypothetical protein